MIQLEQLADLRRQLAAWRAAGERIALVPTMGNLHAGHLELVRRAKNLSDRVVATIFVNPLQFGAGEDLDAYPRTLEEDCEQLRELETDLLFTPGVAEVYTRSQELQTRVEVPKISDILCGATRPGHFTGVATVVCKLFNMVQPDVALFGEKDFQQLLVIRLMAQDLCFPLEIQGVPTVREADGLAMSSRNGYLTADERALAPMLYQALQSVAARLQGGSGDYRAVELEGINQLADAGLKPDYLRILRAADLEEPAPDEQALVILAAAFLGKARLIDNMQLTR